MIELVISGGQTGADQAGWRAAKAAGIPTGGWMPRGFLTEDGPRPEFAELYGAKEHESPRYPPRTEQNVIWSDLTVLFGDSRSAGAKLVLRVERDIRDAFRAKPVLIPAYETCVTRSAQLIWLIKPRTLNVAGNRESSASGIGAWVEAYLTEVFRLLKERG